MARNELQRNATSQRRASGLPAVTILAEAFPKTLSERKRRAILSLLIGTTATEAARQAGVSRETLWRWRNEDAEFIATLNGLKREMAESVLAQVRAMGPMAVAALRELVTNRRTPAAVRLKAVQEILDTLEPVAQTCAGRPVALI